ncbi:MAG: dynamin family protein [Candidatus Sericytochromatia bacterium]
MNNIHILENFNDKVKEVNNISNSLLEIIKKLFPEDNDIKLLEENINRLNNNIFRIIVVGEFKRGKSTFINSLLGENFLPTGITPTTATVNLIKYCENKTAVLNYKDKSRKEISLEDLKFFATTKNQDFEKIDLIEINYPSAICKEKVEIIDSPGVNDIDEQRVEITYNYIPKCDAAIFLLSATQQLSSSERDFISNKVNKYLNKVFFILNKIDQLTEKELLESVNYVKSEIDKVSHTDKIYPLSSKKGTNIDIFEKDLFNFLLEEKGNFLLKNSVLKINNSINKTKSNINMILSALEQSIEDFNKNVEDSKIEFDIINTEKQIINTFISSKKEKITNNVINDLNYSFNAFIPKIEIKVKESLNKTDDEIKKIITSYIKELSYSWSLKIEDFLKIELDEINKFIHEKTGKIYESINKIQANFINRNNIEVDFSNKENILDDLLKNIPDFILNQKTLTSKIARGAIFTIGSIILTGGALVPAILLGGIATFLSDIFLKSWKNDKLQNTISKSIRENFEKQIPIFKENITENLNNFFENELRSKIISEIDSSINSLQKTIDLLVIKKNTKEIENSSFINIYQNEIENLDKLRLDLDKLF